MLYCFQIPFGEKRQKGTVYSMFGNDVFVEYLIKRRRTASDWALQIGAVVLAIVVVWLSFYAAIMLNIPMIPYFVIIGVIYGLYRIWMMFNLEFEYSFTNGDITVDKIIAKRKRKRVVSFDAKNILEMKEVGTNTVSTGNGIANVYRAGEFKNGAGGWYILFSRDGANRNVLLFSPNEKVLTAMKPFLPVKVRLDAFGRN